MRRIIASMLVLPLAGLVDGAVAQADTSVSGHITSDTTWTRDGSPYVMTDTVTVDPGATLTIEPGVVVRASSIASLDVFGSLRAIGEETSPIVFERAADARWGRIRLVGDDQSQTGADAPSIVKHVEVWEGSGLSIDAFPPTISHNLFVGNSTGIQVSSSGPASIAGNVFLANGIAIAGGGGDVEAVRNDFWMNMEAIQLRGGDSDSTWEIHQNDIVSTPDARRGPPGGVVGASCECDLDVGPPREAVVDATDNWWGTTSSSAIESRIVDQEDDPGFASASWEPPAASPHTAWAGYKARATLALRKHLVVSGSITSPEGFEDCYSEVDLVVQRKRRSWSTVKVLTTSATGTFQTRVPDRPGSYRVVSAYSLTGPPSGGYCEGAVSPTRLHSHG